MNAMSFMDKQIMDLSKGSTSPQSKDSIDLMKTPRDEDDQSSHEGASNGITKKDEIFPSYDFQPIRPIGSIGGSLPSSNLDSTSNLGGSTRVSIYSDVKPNVASPIRSYGSLDSIEPAKVILEKDQNALECTIVSEIDRTMKKHADNLIHVLEGVSARLSQLESRTRDLEFSVDDLKTSVGNNYGSTDGKMRNLENILREVQSGVQNIKDKQEKLDAQLQLGKLQLSKSDQQPENQSTVHVNSSQKAVSTSQQAQHQLPPPANLPPSHPSFSPPNASPQLTPQQNLTSPPVQLPNQYPPNQIPSVPSREPYFPTSGPTQETPNQQYQAPSSQQLYAPSSVPHQQYQPIPQPQFSQPPSQPPQQHPPVSSVNPSQFQPPPLHHPEEPLPPYVPSPSYQPGLQLPTQPPSGPPPSQQYYSPPSHAFEPLSSRPISGLTSGYGHPSGLSESYHYGGSPSQYGSAPATKPQQLSSPAAAQGGGSGYPQLPTARPLPHALPTALGVGGSSGSSGSGNKVPIDDVVDRVTSMGFPRDHVRATVRKLTESGQSVDLNIVLDKLTNEGVGGWFGR